ncbi:MAG: hypothetical protein GY820_33450 [Gammaproteobacteria bacterium]|nr:hypothetical protein [Gammaproteobacteria bacterium]
MSGEWSTVSWWAINRPTCGQSNERRQTDRPTTSTLLLSHSENISKPSADGLGTPPLRQTQMLVAIDEKAINPSTHVANREFRLRLCSLPWAVGYF